MADPDTTIDAVRTRDGRTLVYECRGSGEPIVVFEAGMGASHHSWGAVVPLVVERTTTVAYDRSGLGTSPPDTERRDLARLSGDLVELLDHLGSGPFVLVGHSWGGPIVRRAAATVPSRIAGLVLVDQTDEGCDLFFSKANERQTRWFVRLLPLVARLGLLRLVVKRFAAQLPEPSATGMRREDGTVAAARTQAAELAPCTDDLRQLRADPLVLPDVPVTYVSGTVAGRFERNRRTELLEAHRAAAAALPHGRYVDANKSSHYIPLTEPGLVADEILRIVDGGPALSEGGENTR